MKDEEKKAGLMVALLGPKSKKKEDSEEKSEEDSEGDHEQVRLDALKSIAEIVGADLSEEQLSEIDASIQDYLSCCDYLGADLWTFHGLFWCWKCDNSGIWKIFSTSRTAKSKGGLTAPTGSSGPSCH